MAELLLREYLSQVPTISESIGMMNEQLIREEMQRYNSFQRNGKDLADFEDRPFYYDAVVQLMKTSRGAVDRTYDYARALYSTYYQETQALVSQCWPQLDAIMEENPRNKYPDKTDNEYFITMLYETDTIRTFAKNIELCETLKPFGKPGVKGISDDFKRIGCDGITMDFILKSLTWIKDISEKAMKKAANNAYYYWIKSSEE